MEIMHNLAAATQGTKFRERQILSCNFLNAWQMFATQAQRQRHFTPPWLDWSFVPPKSSHATSPTANLWHETK
jgi:hypothetical protein